MNIKILTLALFSLFTFSTMAQETKPKVKEVGITFYNFDQYGAIFKIGQEDRLWRFRILSINTNKSLFGDRDLTGINFNFSAGRERRKSVSDKLNFIYGIELTGEISSYKNKYSPDIIVYQNSYTAGLTGVIGFNYFLSKSVFLGGELLPVAQFTRITNNSLSFPEQTDISYNYNFGFSNNSLLLSVGIKF